MNATGLPQESRLTSVDFVVVAYRSAHLLAGCLDSIQADQRSRRRDGAEVTAGAVVVVDNASPDLSARVAREHGISATVIESAENRGFGGGCNLGAAASSSPFVFFLNPDARIAPGSTALLVRQLQEADGMAAIGPALADPTGAYRAASAGYEPTFRSILGHFLLVGRLPGLSGWFRPLQLPERSPERRPEWISGAALLIRRSAFEDVGGFDASFFMYMEDVDLCRRLREHGWSIGYEPGVVVLHDLGGTQGPEQSSRWARAFHAYLLRRHGVTYAGACSGLAAVGLGLRAIAYLPRRRALGMRLARAARACAVAAIDGRAPTEPPG